ncbi:MAG: bifunctional metallophosphatase/5'-nucleotidase [Polyangiaceae bacterium]
MPVFRLVAVSDVYVLENLPRLATLVETLGRAHPVDRTALVFVGDFLAPSLLSSLDAGRGTILVLNALGVTHATLGNHEDDLETPELLERIRELHATWLGANTPELAPELRSYDIVELTSPLDGPPVRVALVGVVADDPLLYRRPPFGGTRLEPARETLRAVSRELLASGRADFVVPLTHLPIAEDRVLARGQVGGRAERGGRTEPPEQDDPPFAVIVGSHDHVPMDERVGVTRLVKAGQDAMNAIIVELAWPARTSAGEPVGAPEISVRLEAVAKYEPDPRIVALVHQVSAPVRELESATLMKLPHGVELTSVGTRNRQTTVGAMLATRVREATGADVCVLNGGGVRGARSYRERFTFADLQTELPFDNEICVLALSGAELREIVAASRAHAPGDSGGYLQVDEAVEVGPDARTIVAIAGAPLEVERTYRVALMRNLLGGMDRIAPLVELAEKHPERVPPATTGREVKQLVVTAFGALAAREAGGLAALDLDHDGKLSVSEIAAALGAQGGEAAGG